MISLKQTLFVALPFLVLIGHVDQSAALIGDVLDVISLGRAVVTGVLEAWDVVEQTNSAGNPELPFRNKKQKTILKKITQLGRQIDAVEDEVSQSKCYQAIEYSVDSI